MVSAKFYIAVSIIIPCYNQAHYLVESLGSLLSQTMPDWEAIVVDDCSPDGVAIGSIIATIDDPRIHLKKHDFNRGLAASRNTGVKYASADTIVFLDADDLLVPDYCEHTLQYLNKHPHVDAVFGGVEYFGDENFTDFPRQELHGEYGQKLRVWIPGAGVLMRKSVVERIGGYCEAPLLRIGLEDRDFWIASAAHNIVVHSTNKVLYQYRRTPSSMSRKQQPQIYKLHQFIADRHPEFFSDRALKCYYLSQGYIVSSASLVNSGNRFLAARLALIGLRYDWKNTTLQKLLIRAFFPPALWSRLRAVLSRNVNNSPSFDE